MSAALLNTSIQPKPPEVENRMDLHESQELFVHVCVHHSAIALLRSLSAMLCSELAPEGWWFGADTADLTKMQSRQHAPRNLQVNVP